MRPRSLLDRLLPPERRAAVRQRATELLSDAAVALLLVAVAAGAVVGAALGVGALATSAGGVLGFVAAWLLAISFALAVPLVAMKVATWLYATVPR